jgi:hypothetical protein
MTVGLFKDKSMSPFKKKILLMLGILLISTAAEAARVRRSRGVGTRPPPKISIGTFAVSYITWVETVDLSKTVTDSAFASFYGTAFTFEKETYEAKRRGFAFDLSLISGQAGAGGTNTILTYQKSNVNWFGASASARIAYRLSPQITLSAGPMALYRNLDWPDIDGVQAISGSPVNLGFIGDVRMRLSRGWEIRQTIGRLAFRATTIWSLGIGYKF